MKRTCAVLALLLAVVLTGVDVHAQITERVVFARPDPGNPDECEIWISDPLGGNQQQLTDNDHDDVEPKLCGSNKVVFSRFVAGDDNYDIWIMNINSTGAVNLTPGSAGNDGEPDCDNAGTLQPMVVFRSDMDHDLGEIYTVSSAGGLITRLTNDGLPDDDPSWCGSSGDIVFIKHDPLFQPGYHCDPECPQARPVRFNDLCVSGALDDLRRRRVFLMNSQGGNLRQLTGSDHEEGDPSCNVAGTAVVWSSRDWLDCQQRDTALIIRCSLAVPTTQACLDSRILLTVLGGFNQHPTWSPGGTAVAFSSNRTSFDPTATTDFEIYQMDAVEGDRPATGFLHQLTHGPDPVQQGNDVDPDWAEGKIQ